jgi:hypothetical protein
MPEGAPQSEEAPNFVIDDPERIKGLPELTIDEIRIKKQAYNDLVMSLNLIIPRVKFESGSDNPEDQTDESEMKFQKQDELNALRTYAVAEMTRLGHKEFELSEVEKAA